MEQEPNHEEEWMRDICGNSACGQEFYVQPINSRINTFDDHPKCAYIFTHCPHCEIYFMRLYLMDMDPQEFIDKGFPEFREAVTPKHVLASYEAIVASRQPDEEPEEAAEETVAPQQDGDEFWISPRQERIGRIAVEELIWNLQNGHIDNDGRII